MSVKGVERTFSGSDLSEAEGDDCVKCMACQVVFSVCHGGAHDVKKHFRFFEPHRCNIVSVNIDAAAGVRLWRESGG